MQHHNYALSDIENLMPWERDIYVDMLVTFLKEQAEKKREQECAQSTPQPFDARVNTANDGE